MLGKTVQRTIGSSSPEYQQLMQDMFKMVCNPADWKAPIDCIVPFEAAAGFHEAIVFVTGTVPKSDRAPDGRGFRLTSVGYRNGPCGDH